MTPLSFAMRYFTLCMHSRSRNSHRFFVVPPHGALDIPLGQLSGQTYCVWPRWHMPHASQPNSGAFMAPLWALQCPGCPAVAELYRSEKRCQKFRTRPLVKQQVVHLIHGDVLSLSCGEARLLRGLDRYHAPLAGTGSACQPSARSAIRPTHGPGDAIAAIDR